MARNYIPVVNTKVRRIGEIKYLVFYGLGLESSGLGLTNSSPYPEPNLRQRTKRGSAEDKAK